MLLTTKRLSEVQLLLSCAGDLCRPLPWCTQTQRHLSFNISQMNPLSSPTKRLLLLYCLAQWLVQPSLPFPRSKVWTLALTIPSSLPNRADHQILCVYLLKSSSSQSHWFGPNSSSYVHCLGYCRTASLAFVPVVSPQLTCILHTNIPEWSFINAGRVSLPVSNHAHCS